MEDFLPREYLFTPPVHSSPDSMDLSMPDISMLPRPKKTRRGKYDPERDYSAELRRRFHENPSGKRTSRACDRCKVCNDFLLSPLIKLPSAPHLIPIHTIGQS